MKVSNRGCEHTLARKETRDIFNVRRLHLGHVAKAFALTDPPSKSGVLKAERKAKRKSQARSVDKA